MSASASPPPTVPPRPGAITPAKALARLLDRAQPLPAEAVPIAEAAGRTLARDAVAALPLPLETNSAMDGFAVRAADGPWRAALIEGESRAGHPWPGQLSRTGVVQIATGAPLPDGADSVIPIEQAELDGDRVSLPGVEPGRHVRYAGEDVRAGDVLVSAGSTLAPHQLVVLAGAGVAEVACHRRPRAAVVVTGDEVVAPGERPGPGQVIDVHGVALPALLTACGAQVVTVARGVADDPAAVQHALASLPPCDIVLVTGGMSVGRHDHTRAAFAALGAELTVPRLLLRPGQPTAIGQSADGRWWCGLPGNPVSAYVVATLLLLPLLRRLHGASATAAAAPQLPLAQAVIPDQRRWLALRAERVDGPTGSTAVLLAGQASHMMGALAASHALALVPPGDAPLAAGTPVTVECFPEAR